MCQSKLRLNFESPLTVGCRATLLDESVPRLEFPSTFAELAKYRTISKLPKSSQREVDEANEENEEIYEHNGSKKSKYLGSGIKRNERGEDNRICFRFLLYHSAQSFSPLESQTKKLPSEIFFNFLALSTALMIHLPVLIR